MPSRPRVLSPTATSGLYVLAIALGLLFGVIATWISFWSEDALSGAAGRSFGWSFLIILALFLLPAWLVGRVIARVHHRFLPNFLVALSYGPACITGAALVISHWKAADLITPFGGTPDSGFFVFIALIAIAFYGVIASAIVAAVVLSGFLTERFLGRRVIIQPGLTCWVCGYNLGSPTITTCPECGIAFDPDLPPRNASYDFLGFLNRTRRWLLALALVLALVPLAYSITTQTYPAIRFLSSCPRGAQLRHVSTVNYITTTSTTFAHPLSKGWWIPDAPDSDTGIAVSFYPLAIDGKPRMFITRGYLTDPGAALGSPQSRVWWMVYPGTENVVAKLNSAQADEVIRAHSVPPPLIAALRAKAEEVHWTVQSASTRWPSGEQKVDPAPYFPSTP